MTSCKRRTTRSKKRSAPQTNPSLTPYSYDDAEEGGDVDVENKYYNAKQMKTEAPEEAIDEFLAVPTLEEEKGDWGFKGLKQAIKLEFRLGKYEKVSVGGSY
jgi:hypothetical protein